MVAAPLPSPTGPMKRGWRGRGDGGPPNKRPPGGPIPSTLRVLLRSIVRAYIINNLIMTPSLSLFRMPVGLLARYCIIIIIIIIIFTFSCLIGFREERISRD